ncbi:MAG: putative DNA-binding transcriptional regulator [Bacteroidetes bacterium ADurb.Bin217]|nr:MAG: putative DNA-binding transcriptional regulator [Bacteroidetes bacterium ADurb.Bin217]
MAFTIDNIPLIEVLYHNTRVGRIAQTPQQLCAFEYDAEFIQNGFSISPYFLPLRQGLMIAKPQPFGGNFGVFNDSLPDGWGTIILHRYLLSKGIIASHLTILQRLALIGSGGRGALEYKPSLSSYPLSDSININEIADECSKIHNSEEYTGTSIQTLHTQAGSSGGARPKVFVRHQNKEWLVKFKAHVDPTHIGHIEYEYARIAQLCGIIMPQTRLFENKYFGVERFDRTESHKIHTITAAGLLHADYRIPSLDYEQLLTVCLQLTKNMEEVFQLFRRMVFNVIISNRDDHANNFSFQHTNNQWKLSPAYDMLPSTGFNGFHTTTINGQGNPTKADILTVAKQVGITNKQANHCIDEIREICKKEQTVNYEI